MANGISESVLRKTVRKASAGGTYDDLEIGPVPPGEQWFIRRAAGRDATTLFNRIAFAIKSGEYLYWLDEVKIILAADIVGRELNVVLVPGESLVVRFTGCTSADVLHAYVVGEYYEVGEGM